MKTQDDAAVLGRRRVSRSGRRQTELCPQRGRSDIADVCRDLVKHCGALKVRWPEVTIAAPRVDPVAFREVDPPALNAGLRHWRNDELTP